MFAICGTFAKEKKAETKENLVEVTSSEFFSGNYSIQKDNVYKIANLDLFVDARNKVYVYFNNETAPDSFTNSLGKILTADERKRIKRANKYDKFEKKYIVYAQAKKQNPNFSDLIIIKVENIPTDSVIDAEEKRLKDETDRIESERIAKEQAEQAALIAEEQEKQSKFEKQKKELPVLFEKSGKEGFDNMPWGTDADFFLWLKPEAKEIESEGSIVKYELELEQNIKVYKFYEGKLVGGATIYSNIDEQKGDDINHRLVELYGKPSDGKDLGGHKTENVLGTRISYQDTHLKVIWNKSATFKVQLDITAKQLDDYYGMMDKAMFNEPLKFTITYSNEKKMAVIKASDEKKKKAAEAEAQRQRMDNLGL